MSALKTCKNCSEHGLVWGKTNAGKYYLGYPVRNYNSNVMPHRCNASDKSNSLQHVLLGNPTQYPDGITRINFVSLLATFVESETWTQYFADKVLAEFDKQYSEKEVNA